MSPPVVHLALGAAIMARIFETEVMHFSLAPRSIASYIRRESRE